MKKVETPSVSPTLSFSDKKIYCHISLSTRENLKIVTTETMEKITSFLTSFNKDLEAHCNPHNNTQSSVNEFIQKSSVDDETFKIIFMSNLVKSNLPLEMVNQFAYESERLDRETKEILEWVVKKVKKDSANMPTALYKSRTEMLFKIHLQIFETLVEECARPYVLNLVRVLGNGMPKEHEIKTELCVRNRSLSDVDQIDLPIIKVDLITRERAISLSTPWKITDFIKEMNRWKIV